MHPQLGAADSLHAPTPLLSLLHCPAVVLQSGTPTDIIKRPATPFVMNFVGDTNSVPANCLLVRRSGFKNTQGRSRIMFRPSDIQLFTEFR